MSAALTVLATGPLTTVQDGGRPGKAALGIGRSGAADRRAFALANRLLGNDPGAAVLEVTMGGLSLRAEHHVTVATTGARCSGTAPHNAPYAVEVGERVDLGAPAAGFRTYVAVRGGIAVTAVLGSRSTDTLADLGPSVVCSGDVLPVGDLVSTMPGVDVAPVREPESGEVLLRVLAGPRLDWFDQDAWSDLTSHPFVVSSQSNRIGLQLEGFTSSRVRSDELPSEGLVRGAVQIPPSGVAVLFLADHPVTGGYPVVGYVHDDDVDLCAQLRPGQALRFRPVRS